MISVFTATKQQIQAKYRPFNVNEEERQERIFKAELELFRMGLIPPRDPNETWEEHQRPRANIDCEVGESVFNMWLLQMCGPGWGYIDNEAVSIGECKKCSKQE